MKKLHKLIILLFLGNLLGSCALFEKSEVEKYQDQTDEYVQKLRKIRQEHVNSKNQDEYWPLLLPNNR